MLAELSHVMRCAVRTNDLVARLGGDEFAVLMPEANRFAALAVAAAHTRGGGPGDDARWARRCAAAWAVASYAGPPASVDALIHDADTLMYGAKEQGKDRIESAEFEGLPPAGRRCRLKQPQPPSVSGADSASRLSRWAQLLTSPSCRQAHSRRRTGAATATPVSAMAPPTAKTQPPIAP